MNLIIDIGNTNVKTAIFRNDEMMNLMVHDAFGANELQKIFDDFQPSHVISCSVRNEDAKMNSWIERRASYISFSNNTKVPIENRYEGPETLGYDRLAAAVGAKSLYPGKDLLCIDIGTCMTFDFTDQNGVYHGGSISPGIDLRFRSMHHFTHKLPLIEIKDQIDKIVLIGKTTEKSMMSGVINGMASEIDGMISRYRDDYPEIMTILTGGSGTFFESNVKSKIFALPNLVLHGLNTILRHNAN